MKGVLLSTIIILVWAECFAQNPCNEPIVLAPDTITIATQLTIEKNPICQNTFTYEVTRAEFTLGSGNEVIAKAFADNLMIPRALVALAQPGFRLSVKILKVKRVSGSSSHDVPLGKWATFSRPIF